VQGPSKLVQAVTLVSYVKETAGSNLRGDPYYFD
jgi:hypothetical protein